MATHLKANGEKAEVTPKNGTDFTLDELQSFVGGYIEIIWLTPDEIMVVNEEGRLLDLPENDIASNLYEVDVIVGDVLVCDSAQVQ